MAGLSATHRRHILQGFLAIHRRMAEMEALIAQAARSTSSPFAQFTNDLAPVETQVLRDHFARVRAAMLGHLQSLGIPLEARPVSLRWALQTNLTHLQVALDDFGPESLAGYGAVDDEARRLILAIQEDLGRLLDQTAATVRREVGWNLAERLARLDAGRDAGAVLSTLERILARWRLVEFRPLLDLIVSRLEAPRFEIAVFGRVSSGKSSLLNHITGFDVLPVGVTPVTAVPTRLTPGPAPQAVVSFAEGKPQTISVERLGEFASESENPNNIKHVTDILVQLPSPRLREGVVFVDTPGVGALVRDGAAETWAYLPRCDLGLVLIAAASSLGQEDLMLLRTLAASDIPAMVLLSKADLLTPSDRQRVLAHTREQIQAELGLDLPIDLVSVVGADESLLTNWFEQRVQPLLERHRTLLAASLQRKTEGLKASMLAALEGLARRAERSGQRDAGATLATVRARLDEADALIRSARERAFAWSDDRAYLLPIALERAARQTLANPPSGDGGGNNGNAVVAAVLEVLTQRGQMARDGAIGLQEALVRLLDQLPSAARPAGAELSTLRELRLPGLPVPDLGPLAAAAAVKAPWWLALVPFQAVPALERRIDGQYGGLMRDVLEREDRRLQEWLKNVSFQIIKQYESDAMLIREQLRRLSSPATELGGEADRDQLEADLRALRGATPPTRDTACAAAEPAPSLSARAPATTALTHCDRELH